MTAAPCARPGCPALAYAGDAYCAVHRRCSICDDVHAPHLRAVWRCAEHGDLCAWAVVSIEAAPDRHTPHVVRCRLCGGFATRRRISENSPDLQKARERVKLWRQLAAGRSGLDDGPRMRPTTRRPA